MSRGKLTADEIRHTAKLANIKLTPKEIKLFQKQLSQVLEYFKLLEELDTSNIEPTFQVTGLKNIFREDAQDSPGITVDEALKNTKKKYNNYFQVDAVF